MEELIIKVLTMVVPTEEVFDSMVEPAEALAVAELAMEVFVTEEELVKVVAVVEPATVFDSKAELTKGVSNSVVNFVRAFITLTYPDQPFYYFFIQEFDC